MVWTEDGAVPIEQVEPGTRVWAYNAPVHRWQLCAVTGRSQREYEGDLVEMEIRLADGRTEKITSTEGHPYWVTAGSGLFVRQAAGAETLAGDMGQTPGRWVSACDLQLGDQLKLKQVGTSGGDSATITGWRIRSEKLRVYNLTVLRLHNYAVGQSGILVHNGCTSRNQMNKQVQKGKAPAGVKRVDPPHVQGQQPHVHYNNGTSSNMDGTTHDAGNGTPNPSSAVNNWLQQNGWTPPGQTK